MHQVRPWESGVWGGGLHLPRTHPAASHPRLPPDGGPPGSPPPHQTPPPGLGNPNQITVVVVVFVVVVVLFVSKSPSSSEHTLPSSPLQVWVTRFFSTCFFFLSIVVVVVVVSVPVSIFSLTPNLLAFVYSPSFSPCFFLLILPFSSEVQIVPFPLPASGTSFSLHPSTSNSTTSVFSSNVHFHIPLTSSVSHHFCLLFLLLLLFLLRPVGRMKPEGTLIIVSYFLSTPQDYHSMT